MRRCWIYLIQVSKQRPSKIVSRRPALASKPSPTQFQAAYWYRRLFKNTFTRDGQRTALKGWSVKIQHQGRRQTFSLTAANRAAAAREAWQIYQTIIAPGREATGRQRGAVNSEPTAAPPKPPPGPLVAKDASYWKPRLLSRKYLEFAHSSAPDELSVRVEHAGTSHYFLLGTLDEDRAAAKAVAIYQTVTTQGWETANVRFDRELTVALHWSTNPVAWTYATLRTQKRNGPHRPVNRPPDPAPELGVAIIEPDAGIRFALATGVNSQAGCRCEVTFASATEALQKIPRHRLHLLLANHILPDQSGLACLEAVQHLAPHLAGVAYSVYKDSDELFSAAPGGAVGYLLKRTSPCQLLEPLAGSVGPLTRESIAARIREFFQNLLTALPAGPSGMELAKLTAREHEILTFLSQGRVAKEIASRLGISIWTVHGHVKNIFEKLHVHTRTEAVVKFLQK